MGLNNKELFDIFKTYSRDYTMVCGFAQFKEEDGEIILRKEILENELLSISGIMMDGIAEVFKDDLEVEKEGYYFFTALIQTIYDYNSMYFEIAHIEWDFCFTLEEYDSQQEIIDNEGDIDLPF